MRITVSQLKRIIKEEVSRLMETQDVTVGDVLAAAGLQNSPLSAFKDLPTKRIGSASSRKKPGHTVFYDLYEKLPEVELPHLVADAYIDAKYEIVDGKLGGGTTMSRPGSGLDISGPPVTIEAGGDGYDLEWPSEINALKAELQGAVQWLSGLSPKTRINFTAANGMMLTAFDPAEDEVDVDEISIDWSRSPGAMAKNFSRVVSFLDKNSMNLIRGDVD